MYSLMLLVLKAAVILHIGYSFAVPLVPIAPISNVANSSIPQYRFHYYVKDEKTGDYKAQEEHRTGDSVTGSYMVGEPNGDLRVVTYIADVSSGFKADVSVQPGGSPLRNGTSNVPTKEGIATFNNYRSGISAPPKNRKPSRGFNPIVVNSLTSLGGPPITSAALTEPSTVAASAGHPYPYYKDSPRPNSSTAAAFVTSTATPKKSVQVDLTFNDDAVVETGEKDTVLPHHRKSESTTTESNWQLFSYAGAGTANTAKNPAILVPTHVNANSGIYQLRNMDIPSSVLEILNQNKGKSENSVRAADTTTTATTSTSSATPFVSTPLTTDTTKQSESSQHNHENGSLKIDLTPSLNEATYSTEPATAASQKKVTIPQRPMRLIGLSPIFVDTSQLQTITENLTSLPQMHFEPFSNMQYATPAPLHSGPLQGGPVGPFRNLPRSVSETMAEYSLINAVPIVNSIPISAPIISQSFAHIGAGGGGGPKPDAKLENKAPTQPLSLCSDCLLPTNYVPYPVAKPPTPSASNSNQKTPCPSQNTPYWAPYMPNFAYILMPTPIIKSKINETRPFTPGPDIWRK